jgi:hypothetical protein
VSREALLVAAGLTARYSDIEGNKVLVNYRRGAVSGKISVEKTLFEELSPLHIS